MRSALAAAALLLSCAACDDEPEQVDPPMVAGPYLGTVQLGPDTRTRLPSAAETIGPDDRPRFYWYCADAPGKTITWEVRAETTALEHGALIHTAEEPVGAGTVQGMVRIDPSRLSRGGARRSADGRLEWLPGIYSVKGRLDGAEPFGTGIFEVR